MKRLGFSGVLLAVAELSAASVEVPPKVDRFSRENQTASQTEGAEDCSVPGGSGKRFSPGRWHYPSVYEQYSCYISIDASASKLIAAYLALYRAERNPLDLAKARTLANAITQVQEPSGRVPTFWSAGSKDAWLADVRYDWLNCMASCAKELLDVDAVSSADGK